jgi:hypothetical protein
MIEHSPVRLEVVRDSFLVQVFVQLSNTIIGGQSQHRAGGALFYAGALAIAPAQIAFVGAEVWRRRFRLNIPPQCATWTLFNAQATFHATRVVDRFAFAGVVAYLDADWAIVAAHATLHAARGVSGHVTVDRLGLMTPPVAPAARLRNNPLEEPFTFLVLARQQHDDAIRAGFDALVAAPAGFGHKGLAGVQVHPVEVAGIDTGRIGAVAADVGQLILAEDRAAHCHSRAAVTLPAGVDAYVTVDTFPQIANQYLSQNVSRGWSYSLCVLPSAWHFIQSENSGMPALTCVLVISATLLWAWQL